MSAAAEWMVSENGRSLNLVVERETFATITRWADRKTGEHAWWAVERHDGYGLGLSEHLASACRRAAAAANIDLAPPQDLIDEWGHEDPEEQEAERSTPVASEPAFSDAPRTALCGRCSCGHIWPVVYLPMPLAEAAQAMSHATCPMCGNATGIKVADGVNAP